MKNEKSKKDHMSKYYSILFNFWGFIENHIFSIFKIEKIEILDPWISKYSIFDPHNWQPMKYLDPPI